MTVLRAMGARLLLVCVYGVTWLVATVGKALPHRQWKPTGRIAVTGTFHNPNWYLSHITPLARSGVKEVILVIDEPQDAMERVRFACPPKWLARLTGRAGAKAIWMIGVGIRYKPDLFMGYSLVAGGCTALIAAGIRGRPACYQMTGGQVVLSTVDPVSFACEKTSSFRQWFSTMTERLAVRVIRKFDLVIVRGSKAKAFLAQYGMTKNVTVITGSVRTSPAAPRERDIDLVFVGRLEPIKQVHQFLEIVQAVSRTLPTARAAIVGDGCLMGELKAYADKLGVKDRVQFLGKRKDVEEILAASKVFVLTSQSEGLSIAMAEAMSSGVVPVVANVGELSDLVSNNVNGYLIQPDRIDEYVERIIPLLEDQALWERCSHAAVEAAGSQCGIDVVTEQWHQQLRQPVARACRRDPADVWH